jgi:hypothetical protein
MSKEVDIHQENRAQLYTTWTKLSHKIDLFISAASTLGRVENRAETDGNKWCHICFHIFMWKQK